MLGVIAAGNPQTVAAGEAVLQQGGNAVDAVVAAAFASFIAEIGVVHLGGSGMAHIFDPRSGESVVYDFFSTMPGVGNGIAPEHLDFERVIIDYGATTQDFHLGRASVAVPGNVFGLCRLAADHGRLPLSTLLEPALKLAREGAVLDRFQADTCRLLEPLYTHTAGMRRIFAPRGAMIACGDRLIIPHLEQTLQQLAEEGAALMRSGSLGRAIISDQARKGGLIGPADLRDYAVSTARAIRVPYRQYEVLLPPPPSTGGVLTAFTLKLLRLFPIGRQAHGSAGHLSLLYEAMAATTRARPFWEKAASDRPVREAVAYFLDDAFVAPFAQEVREALDWRQPSEPAPEEGGPANTSHMSVIDGAGMAVALTTTAGESAGYVVPGTGFIPNNILGEEDLNPGGFHRWQPGQRIPTMMAPTVVLDGGRIRLVTGSGGSNRIRSALLQTFINVLDYGLPLQQAVNAPRVHLERGLLQCERGHDAAALDQLEGRGYEINRWAVRSIYFGGAHSVALDSKGEPVAAGDDRRGGSTAVITRR